MLDNFAYTVSLYHNLNKFLAGTGHQTKLLHCEKSCVKLDIAHIRTESASVQDGHTLSGNCTYMYTGLRPFFKITVCHLCLPSSDAEGILFNLLHYPMKQLQILTSRAGKFRLRAHL